MKDWCHAQDLGADWIPMCNSTAGNRISWQCWATIGNSSLAPLIHHLLIWLKEEKAERFCYTFSSSVPVLHLDIGDSDEVFSLCHFKSKEKKSIYILSKHVYRQKHDHDGNDTTHVASDPSFFLFFFFF